MTIEAWQAQIKEAAARSGKLHVRGSGGKAFVRPWRRIELPSIPARACRHRRVRAEQARHRGAHQDAARRVEQAMASAGQMLAFEPPHFGADATVGGALACGLSGPRRPYAGALRDYVLGAKVIDGRASIFHSAAR